MKKITIFKGFILLGLTVVAVTAAFAQKPQDNIGKTSTPRTDTVPVVVGSGAPTNDSSSTTGVQGTNQPNPDASGTNATGTNPCMTGYTLVNGMCVLSSSVPVPASGTCMTGYTLVNGMCVLTDTTTNNNTAPMVGSSAPTTNNVPVNGTTTTSGNTQGPCQAGYVYVNGLCTPNTNSSTGVNGTSQPNPNTNPNTNDANNGTLGTKTQVGGVSQEKPGNVKSNGKSNGKSGGRVMVGSGAPATVTNPNSVPVTAVSGDNSAITAPGNANLQQITIQDDGRQPVTPPLNPGGVEVNLKNSGQPDWSKPFNAAGDTTAAPSKTASVVNRSPAVVEVQTSKKDAVTENKSCEDEALQKIYSIITHDNSNVLGKMYELTTMRLARKALEEGNVTLEGYTRNKIGDLEKQMNTVKNSPEIQSQVKAVYETYGKPEQLQGINKELDDALKQGKKACYWSSRTHLWNTDAASYVLAASLADKDSGLTDADAAVIWTVEKIRKAAAATNPLYRNGGKYGNMMNISNRVARYLGTIQGGKSSSKADLDKAIGDQEQAFVQMMSAAYGQVKASLFACIDGRNKTCADCAHKQKEQFEQANLGLDQIQRGLMQAVAKSENVKVEGAMKGKMGDIKFDFNNLAKGTVVQAPDRMNKFDACGQPKFTPGTQAAPKVEEKKTTPAAPKYNFNDLLPADFYQRLAPSDALNIRKPIILDLAPVPLGSAYGNPPHLSPPLELPQLQFHFSDQQ